MTKALHTTWMILQKDGKILLGMKKRGFGVGKLNGIGGKVEPGETTDEAAVRETFEEIGVKVTKMKLMGEIVFDNLYYHNRPERMMMHCYVATAWEGQPEESDEIKPEWVKMSEVPYNKLWEDDQYWLPAILRGEEIQAHFRFNAKNEMQPEHWVKPKPTKIVIRLDEKTLGMRNFGHPETFTKRYAARAVLVDQNWRVALINATKRGYYKLPGGGIEDGELILEALDREVAEEAGYRLKVLDELGISTERRSKFNQHNISYGYLCRATKFIGTTLMEDEAEDGFELQWFDSIDQAIAAVAAIDTSDMIYQAKFFTKRELEFLKVAKRVIEQKYGK